MGAKKLKTKKPKLKHNYIKRKLSLVETIDDYKLEEISEKDFFKYMNVLHDNEDGYVSLFKKAKGVEQRWSLSLNELEKLDIFQDERNFYYSVNTIFVPGKHSTKYIHKLNAFIIDLDYYKVKGFEELTATQIVALLEGEKDYPEPSFYIDSGRGLYIIWLLENTYGTTASKRYWKKIEKTLIEIFSDYGVDTKVSDCARVLRLIGSKHSITGRTVKLVQSPYRSTSTIDFDNVIRYEMGDIADYFWGCRELCKADKKPKKKKKKKKKSKQTKVIQIKNTYTLNYNRCRDIETLVELRADKKEKGWREKLLFLYRLNLLYSHTEPQVALDMTLALNNKLGLPLDDDEVISSTSNAEGISEVYHRLMDNYEDTYDISLNKHLSNGGAYIYSNETIIEELEITDEEQSKLTTIIGDNEKKIRKDNRNKEYYEENKIELNLKKKEKYQEKLKSNGKLTRAEQNEIIRAEIKSLLEEGKKQQEIADILGVNVRTVKRHIKAIKDNN